MRTVEECHSLDVYDLRRKGVLDPGKRARINFGQMATLHFVAADDHLEIVFLETPYVKTTERSYLELERTLTSFDAERVQFLCPRCFKPKAKLYLPPGQDQFRCRTCHNLSYKSRQSHPSGLSERDVERILLQVQALKEEMERKRLQEAAATRRREKRLLAPPAGSEESTEISAKRPRGRPKTKRSYERTRPFLTNAKSSPAESICLGCRAWRVAEGEVPVVLGNGRAALRGTCPVCKGVMVRIIKPDAGLP
jgi:Zn finger protein HypA/HybF involved in hydrogenase expression